MKTQGSDSLECNVESDKQEISALVFLFLQCLPMKNLTECEKVAAEKA